MSGCWAWPAVALAAAALAATSCQPRSTGAAAAAETAGTGAGTGTGTGAAAAVHDPLERRRQRPVVIGGCDATCATPEAAVLTFFAALQAPDRADRLRPLVEWSLLVVDGEPLGERWADLWGDPARHAERDASIDAWLRSWSAWVERAETPVDFAAARAAVGLVRVDDAGGEAPPRFEIAFRHPKLRGDGGGEPVWRLGWTRRGYEWLLSGIDHAPGQRRPAQ